MKETEKFDFNDKELKETPEKIKKFRALMEETKKQDLEKSKLQNEKGKFTARERLQYLLDENSFFEIHSLVETRCQDFGLKEKHLKGDGVITGFGRINGREVAIFAQDFTQLGGSLGLAHAKKIAYIMDRALEAKIPIIGLLDSGGARIQEGVDSLDGYGEIFKRNVKCSGIIPQISVILGPCAGGAVYSPALTDFIFMVDGISHMFVTGPNVVKAATGEEVDLNTLGGSKAHAQKSGVCHVIANSEQDCFRQVRELLTFLPQNCKEKPICSSTLDVADRQTPMLEKLSSMDPGKPFRIHHIIWELADENKFFEIHRDYAKNIITGFVKLGGEVVGIVANNSDYLGGALDLNASDKAARFVRFLNNFNIPILTLVDIGGYLPGVEQEHGGIIRHGAKLLYAYGEATVPKITLVIRKAYGGAYIAMGSKALGADFNFALPSAEFAVMGPRGAVEILYAKELKAAAKDKAEELKEKLTKEYAQKFASPYQTAASGSIDEIIEPSKARSVIIRALKVLAKKRIAKTNEPKGNIPL